MAWPTDAIPVKVQLQVGGEWVSIPDADVLGRDPVRIGRGRANEDGRARASTCDLSIRNVDGKYSPRNPLSPYYGLLGRNTPLRVLLPEVASGGQSGVVSTSIVAPSVDASDAGLLVSMWLACDNTAGTYNLTVPVSMTAGAEVDESWSTSRTATETITSGATGERTATSNTSADRWAALSAVIPGAPVVVEALADSAINADVTLTTGSGTQVGWWLLAMHGFDIVGNRMSAPSGDGWIEVGDSGGIGQRIRAWVRRVDTAGAQAVVFANDPQGGQPDNHGRVWVLSGWDGGLPSDVARRFVGEVPSWPPKWNADGSDVWVPIQAAGILRRLEQGSTSLKSPVYREVMSDINAPHLVAYWPGEDGSDAKQVSSAVGHPPMTHTIAPPSFGSGDSFPGSDPLLTMVNGALIGAIPGAPGTGSISFRGLFHIPQGIANNALIADVYQSGGGSVRIWRLKHTSSGNLNLQGVQADGSTVVVESGGIGFDIRGARELIGFEVVQSGANVAYHIYTRHITSDGGVGSVIEGGYANTFASVTVGSSRTLVIGANGLLTDTVAGHFMVGSSDALTTTLDEAIVGYRGETAVARMTRLCSEEGINFSSDGGTSSACGPQRAATLLQLLSDAADVDAGILYEPRHVLGLAYRTRASLYNQAPTLTLDYAAEDLAPPLEPVDDDQTLRNDVTASRFDGGTARAVLESGPLSIQRPEDGGAGRYELPLSVNADTDAQLSSIAGWHLHLRTWDESRYPVVTVSQLALETAGKRSLVTAAATADVGNLATIDNPPVWLPPEQIGALLQGSSETIDGVEWEIAFNATPAGPYRVFVLDDPVLGRLETAGSELTAAAAPGATSLSVVATQGPLWQTGAQDFEVNVSGAGLHVTNIANAVTDAFGGTSSSGWTPADTGQSWSHPFGSASDYTEAAGKGTISLAVADSLRGSVLDVGTPHAAYTVDLSLSVGSATTQPITLWVCAGWVDVNNYNFCRLSLSTGGVMSLGLLRRNAGSLTTITSSVTGTSNSANDVWRVTWSSTSDTFTATMRNVTTGAATTTIRGPSSGAATGTGIAILARRESGNTVAATVSVDNLAVTNPQTFTVDSVAVNGVSKTLPAGSAVTTRGIGALAL